mmetsp:Transcript_5678/g.13184  ORF Transcript_5678/g.13184 Transcript_5678/m.13184 type:complete len:227 (-) Transcript_5678:1489-2169(-)
MTRQRPLSSESRRTLLTWRPKRLTRSASSRRAASKRSSSSPPTTRNTSRSRLQGTTATFTATTPRSSAGVTRSTRGRTVSRTCGRRTSCPRASISARRATTSKGTRPTISSRGTACGTENSTASLPTRPHRASATTGTRSTTRARRSTAGSTQPRGRGTATWSTSKTTGLGTFRTCRSPHRLDSSSGPPKGPTRRARRPSTTHPRFDPTTQAPSPSLQPRATSGTT